MSPANASRCCLVLSRDSALSRAHRAGSELQHLDQHRSNARCSFDFRWSNLSLPGKDVVKVPSNGRRGHFKNGGRSQGRRTIVISSSHFLPSTPRASVCDVKCFALLSAARTDYSISCPAPLGTCSAAEQPTLPLPATSRGLSFSGRGVRAGC